MVVHPIDAVFDENSTVLILGSFPSVKSREEGFFYGHPQNRFWRVIAALFDCDVPKTIDGKKRLLLKSNVAVWDVIYSCDICGSSDSSIKNVVPNDILPLLDNGKITKIFTNGKTADRLYKKYIFPKTNIPAFCLPSTSPANARVSLDELIEIWSQIKE